MIMRETDYKVLRAIFNLKRCNGTEAANQAEVPVGTVYSVLDRLMFNRLVKSYHPSVVTPGATRWEYELTNLGIVEFRANKAARFAYDTVKDDKNKMLIQDLTT
jgi:DNA-binding PadR family transcriptional regulator